MTVRVVLVALALAAALVPLPEAAVERWYSTGVYPRLQSIVTPLTNLVPIALFDVAILSLLAAAVVWFGRLVARRGTRTALVRGVGALAVTGAVVYLAFLAMWGLNYRRVPLERKLDYDAARVSREAAVQLGVDAVRRVNESYRAAQAIPVDDRGLAAAFAEAERLLGGQATSAPGRPKRSLLGLYFRQAAISGMTVPFFLEIILNPDLLPAEHPFTLAHEWAHLAGYADESEANFLAWLTCLRGDARAQYSGWLETYLYVAGSLSRDDRRRLPPLDPGPRSDLQAMRERDQRASPFVRAAARGAYDSYLRANRVPEGIESYGIVLRLMVGTAFEPGHVPRLRSQ